MAGIWTRNFYNLLSATLLCDDTLSNNTQPTSYEPPIRVRLPGGTWQGVAYKRGSGSTNVTGVSSFLVPGKFPVTLGTSYSPTMPSDGVCICFGSGSTAASYEDYRVQTPITSGLSLGNASGALTQASAYDAETYKMSSERSYTITNSSASTINVNEMALYAKWDYGSGDGCCIYREVFDNTIALAPGESLIVGFKRDAVIYNYTPYPA